MLALSVPNAGYSKNAERTKFDIYVLILLTLYLLNKYKDSDKLSQMCANVFKRDLTRFSFRKCYVTWRY